MAIEAFGIRHLIAQTMALRTIAYAFQLLMPF